MKNLIIIRRPQAVCCHDNAPDLPLGLEENIQSIRTKRADVNLVYFMAGCSKCNRITQAWVNKQIKHFKES